MSQQILRIEYKAEYGLLKFFIDGRLQNDICGAQIKDEEDLVIPKDVLSDWESFESQKIFLNKAVVEIPTEYTTIFRINKNE